MLWLDYQKRCGTLFTYFYSGCWPFYFRTFLLVFRSDLLHWFHWLVWSWDRYSWTVSWGQGVSHCPSLSSLNLESFFFKIANHLKIKELNLPYSENCWIHCEMQRPLLRIWTLVTFLLPLTLILTPHAPLYDALICVHFYIIWIR